MSGVLQTLEGFCSTPICLTIKSKYFLSTAIRYEMHIIGSLKYIGRAIDKLNVN
jgi:hypothetical protein